MVLPMRSRSSSNDDLDRIGKTIHQCETNATGHDEKVLFDQGIKALPKLRAARDHAVKSYAAFAKESAKAEMRLTAIAAAIDKLPATQQSRAQLADLRNEAASINFRVNEQRSAAVGRNEKSDEFPPFRQVTIAALRKESEIEDGLRQSRQAEAEASVTAQSTSFAKLNIADEVADKSIFLENPGGGGQRWLTLRQFVSLVMSKTGSDSVAFHKGSTNAGEEGGTIIDLMPPHGTSASFLFQSDGDTLVVKRLGQGGKRHDLNTPDDRSEANDLLQHAVESRK